MKIFSWVYNNILFLITLFLLAFIPLYPKRPLIDIQHTWVYVRVEDFVVAFVLMIWIGLLLLRKVTLKTPLTLPIFIFWIIGGLATLHGVLLIFPETSGLFSNVALLSFLRKIEYMSLFFVAYASIKDKKNIYPVIAMVALVLVMVVIYGLGQKYLGFPAFLTMNEEFAKGVPIQISQLSRVPSTFAGHYDLAAYLVLVIPLLVSIAFGFRNWFIKLLLFGSAASGFLLLFMTVSRVSVFVLLVAMGVLLLIHKKRILILSLIIVNLVFLSFFPSLIDRFGNTVTEIDVLVDAQTGEAIGNAREISSQEFQNKVIVKKTYENKNAVYGANREDVETIIAASSSAVLPHTQLPEKVFILVESNAPTGENLPQGTGYVNLSLSPVKEKLPQFYYHVPVKEGEPNDRVVTFQGNFLIKRAKAYDLSYTTRFQGEWPRTIDAFKENILLGSGYGSVSLAVDNNYLRILGETGILGFGAFMLLFVVSGLYIKKALPYIDSPVVKNFVLGMVVGTLGLMLNAVLIDVFEASKIAFTYWLLMGITLGVVHLYTKESISIVEELKKIFKTGYSVGILLVLLTIALFSSSYHYYFVGDDFTWLRWAASCADSLNCNSVAEIVKYFTHSDGFFYRPGTKLYFLIMYNSFWLNQTMYHIVSISLHTIFAFLVFLVSRRVIKDYWLAVAASLLFLIISGHAEEVLWISSTGHLFNAVFSMLSLLFFILWKDNYKKIFFVLALVCIILSMLFHELGVVVPLLLIVYDVIFNEKVSIKQSFKNSTYWILLTPIIPYLALRLISGSHWLNGDYSYNLLKLPFNFIGNTLGYLLVSLVGSLTIPLSNSLRFVLKNNLAIALPLFIVLIIGCYVVYKFLVKKLSVRDKKIILFSILFFIIALLPFIGLGNITSRYSYLASVGVVWIFVFLLQKVYAFIKDISDTYTSVLTITIILIVFVSHHVFQLQKIHSDWHAAGERSERLVVSLNEIYSDGWTQEDIKLFFVDVPIKYGEAWIFPVGLKDAVWFVYKNDKIGVYQVPSIENAFNNIQDPQNEKVFSFDGEGRLIEKIKPGNSTKIK